LLYWKRSLSPTATLYELGIEGMADQNELPEPIVTVLVAAAIVAADESRGGADSNCGELSATVGIDSTVIPRAAEAVSEVPRLEESEVCTAAAVVEAGTAMVAVMRTLAAATLIVTSDLSTPAAVAMACCKLEVSE